MVIGRAKIDTNTITSKTPYLLHKMANVADRNEVQDREEAMKVADNGQMEENEETLPHQKYSTEDTTSTNRRAASVDR